MSTSTTDFQPTDIPPGPNKIAVFQERAAKGLPLFHEDDDLSKPAALVVHPARDPHSNNRRVGYAVVYLPTAEVIHQSNNRSAALAVCNGDTLLCSSPEGHREAAGMAVRKALKLQRSKK